MRIILLFLLPLFLYADSLRELLLFSHEHNELIVSKHLLQASKKSDLKSVEKSFYPRVNLGGFYNRGDEPNPFLPGTTYASYAKLSFDLYSGGSQAYTKAQKSDELLSSKHEYEAIKKDISLSIVQDFYALKNIQAKIKTIKESLVAVRAELERVEKYLNAKLATSDDVDRLQASYDKNRYFLESAKFELLSLKKGLELKVGKNITSFKSSNFMKKENNRAETLDSIKGLQYRQSALFNATEIVGSYYYPHIRLEDTYTLYGYQDRPSFGGIPIPLLDKQNVVMLTVNLNLFDFGSVGEKKQSVQLKADALAQEIVYKTKEQKMHIELAKSRIKTAELNIKSAKSALFASSSALKTITQKYRSAIVDNIVYLDALSSKTEASASYEASLNNLEMAYALYYYYTGKKLEEFLHE